MSVTTAYIVKEGMTEIAKSISELAKAVKYHAEITTGKRL